MKHLTRPLAIVLTGLVLAACSPPSEGPLPQGAINMVVSGLPQGASANITVSGPGFSQNFNGSAQIPNLTPGQYIVSANPVTSGEASYQPTPSNQIVNVISNGNAPVIVAYTASNLGPDPTPPTPPAPDPTPPTPPTPTQFTLTVTRAGNGQGTVTSAPAGINCGNNCRNNYNQGTTVTLTAQAATGSTFTGWGGDCSGSGATCTVTMSQTRNVTATFSATGPAPTQYPLTVEVAGTGGGTVTSSPPGINCGENCTQNYNEGTVVTLTAQPSSSPTFVGWSGDCSGSGATCTVTMNQARSVTATFRGIPANVTAMNVANNTATVSWSAVPGATEYEVEQQADRQFSPPTSTVVTGTQANLTGLASNLPYTVRVRARSLGGWGAWSTPITVTSVETRTPTAPPAIQGFTAVPEGDGIRFNWTPNTRATTTSVTLRYRQVGSETWQYVSHLYVERSTYFVPNVPAGTYEAQIQAWNKYGLGEGPGTSAGSGFGDSVIVER